MRYRKNINCLTTDELHDLREALAAMYALPASDPNSFAKLASFHGGPPTTYCRHGAPGFFTWHRAYLLAFENALTAVGCHVSLPYWDWSSGPSTGVPAACRNATYVNRSGATAPNPLSRGPRPAGGQTSRRADIDTTAFDDLAASAQAAMTTASFTSFQNQIDGVHGGVHVRTGGDMSSVPSAAYDPIFYLHHANIDRLWADWQAAHPGLLPAAEATLALQPFNRPFTTQWQTGSDMESTTTLGYQYRRYCLFLPPIRLWEVAVLPIPWEIRDRMASARVLVRSTQVQHQALEIRAFVDQAKATERTKTIGNPAFAGAVGFLGHAGEKAVDDCDQCRKHNKHGDGAGHGDQPLHAGHGHGHQPRPTETERFDVELDLTAALSRLDRETEDVAVKLVAVNADGDKLSADEVNLEGIELVVD